MGRRGEGVGMQHGPLIKITSCHIYRPQVFAAGDCASCVPYPRPKAGVYAVRQGPPLDRNLRAFLTGQPLEPFVPQATNLSLFTTGETGGGRGGAQSRVRGGTWLGGQ